MFETLSSLADSKSLIATILILVLCGFIVLNLVFFYFKRKRHHEKEQLLKFQFDQASLEAQLEIQEQTLKNISQEIHDNIGQALILLKLNITSMDLGQPEMLIEKIDLSKVMISTAIQDLRTLAKTLNTDYVSEVGLLKSIDHEFELIKKSSCYRVTCILEGEEYPISV